MTNRLFSAPNIGCLVGICGWFIGLVGLCTLTGSWEVLRRTFWVGLSISLSLGLAFIITVDLVRQHCGTNSRIAGATTWGMLSLVCAVLLLLMDHWLLPIIRSDPRLDSTLVMLSGSYGGLAPGLLLVSTILLGWSAYQLNRSDGWRRKNAQCRIEVAEGN